MSKKIKSLVSIFLALLTVMWIVDIPQFNVEDTASQIVAEAATEKWSWPVYNTSSVKRGFTGVTEETHSGLDITGKDAATPILASRSGKVVSAYPKRCTHINTNSAHCNTDGKGTYGNFIVIEHTDDDGKKWYSLYAHLLYDSLRYKVGDTVPQGAVIAQMGSSGASTGTHLHFEIRANKNSWTSTYVKDPANYVKKDVFYRADLASNMLYKLPTDRNGSSNKLPATLATGTPFDVYGLIFSDRLITNVWGGIYQQGTDTKVQFYEDTAKTYLYSLNTKFDKNLLFDKLPEGFYTYRIYAKDDKKEYKLVEQNFQVGNPAKNFTVTLNGNGVDVSPATMKVTVGSTYAELPALTRTGYTFAGWYTAASGGTKVTDKTTVTTAADHTLYAQWTPRSYTVTYDANGGTCSVDTQSVKFDSAFTDIPTAERNGYIFDGWYSSINGGTKYTASTKMTLDSDITLFARWMIEGTPSDGAMFGDVNLDNTFDQEDIGALQSYLLNKATFQSTDQIIASDVLSDSVVDAFDLCILKRMYFASKSQISISDTEKNLMTGETYQLTASVTPDYLRIEWESSDSNIVSVENGMITGVSAGTAVITAYIQTGNIRKTAVCNVVVEEPTVKLSSTTGSSSDTNVYKSGSKFYAMITNLPSYTTNVSGGTVNWSVVSGDATISSNKLYINQPGTVTARATLTYNGKTYTADYTYKRTVTFTADVAYTLRSKPSSSGSALASMPKGTKLTVSAIDATDSTYIWGKVTYNGTAGYVILWHKDGSAGGIITG